MNMLMKSLSSAALVVMLSAVPASANPMQPAGQPVLHLQPGMVTIHQWNPLRVGTDKIYHGNTFRVGTANPVRQGFGTPVRLIGVKNGHVQLRLVAETAGGTVAWDGAKQTVTVTMSDRKAIFVIGQDQAEIYLNGSSQPNAIKLEGAVTLVGGRTMVPGNAINTVLGLTEKSNQATSGLTAGRRVMDGAHVTPTAVAEADAPAELRTWAVSVAGDQAGSHKVVTVANGMYVGIAAGQQPSAGYRVELVGDAHLVGDTWVIEVKVLPAEGFSATVLTNPIAFYHLPGVQGNVAVHLLTGGQTR